MNNIKEKVLNFWNENNSNRLRFYTLRQADFYDELLNEIDKLNLPEDWDFKRKLWHLFNGDRSECLECHSETSWRENYWDYTVYCSQECVQISELHKERLISSILAYWNNDEDGTKKKNHRAATLLGFGKSMGLNIKQVSLEEIQDTVSKRVSEDFLSKAKTFLNNNGIERIDELTEEEIRHQWGLYFGEIIQNRSPEEKEKTNQQRKETNLEIYGSEGTLGNEEIAAKYRQTNLERYGVEYPLQNEEIYMHAYNSRCKKKEFVMPSGKIVEVQGYEPWALKELLDNGIDEDDILTQGLRILWSDTNNIEHAFYPDILIKSENKIVEVKSTYTWEKDLDINMMKLNSTKDQGYLCEFWVYDGKRNKKIYA